MKNRNGFVVVQKSPSVNRGRFNSIYRGVDRLVPWSKEKFGNGFNDPYLSAKYTTDDGFIRNLPLAKEVVSYFSEIVGSDNLEILYIMERSGAEELGSLPGRGLSVLGFDVAGNESPFYSIVNDFPPPSEVSFQGFREQLNENGLLGSVDLAREYLTVYLQRYPEERDQEFVIWEVYLSTD